MMYKKVPSERGVMIADHIPEFVGRLLDCCLALRF